MVGIFGNVKKVSVYFAVGQGRSGRARSTAARATTRSHSPRIRSHLRRTSGPGPCTSFPNAGWSTIRSTGIRSAAPRRVEESRRRIHHRSTSRPSLPARTRRATGCQRRKGPFWPMLRTYGPGKSILDKTWKMPQAGEEVESESQTNRQVRVSQANNRVDARPRWALRVCPGKVKHPRPR